MFCHKCGTELQQGDAFCASCGSMVAMQQDGAAHAPTYPTQQQVKNSAEQVTCSRFANAQPTYMEPQSEVQNYSAVQQSPTPQYAIRKDRTKLLSMLPLLVTLGVLILCIISVIIYNVEIESYWDRFASGNIHAIISTDLVLVFGEVAVAAILPAILWNAYRMESGRVAFRRMGILACAGFALQLVSAIVIVYETDSPDISALRYFGLIPGSWVITEIDTGNAKMIIHSVALFLPTIAVGVSAFAINQRMREAEASHHQEQIAFSEPYMAAPYAPEVSSAAQSHFAPSFANNQGTEAPTETAPRFCAFCGTEIPDDQRFCHHCGKER